MGEPSVPTTPANEARGSHARNNHPQSDLPVGIEWPLRAESGSEGIPLTLLRDPDTGGNVGNAAERDYRANAEGLSSTQPLLDQYCRSSVDYDGPEPSDVSQKQHKVTGGDVRPPTHHARSWRPTWLQPTILLSFTISFLLLAVGLPVLFRYSRRHEGVRKARPKFVHLWRFGPTAILTVVSILWSRVELQALRYEPWTVFLQEQPSAKRAAAYTLDYTSLLPPAVLVHSFRRGHYCVFFASIVSLILKIQIALAPGLFSSASIEVSQPVDFRVLDLFNTSVIFPNKETTAYYARQVFQNFEMRYPFGLTESAAYQTFGIGQQSSRGTVDAPLEVVVDGFLSDTQCLKLENYSLKKTVVEKYYFSFTMELQFENCEVLAQKYMYSLGSENELTGGVRSLWVIDHLLHTEHACQNLAQDASPELYSGLRFEIPPGNNSQPIVLDFAATLCSSTSWVSKVKVLDDGISPIVTTIPNGIKTPIKAELWTLISMILPPEASDWVLEGGPVQTEYAMRENRNYSTLDDNPSFYTSDVLYGASMNISRVLGPWAGHYLLREQHGDNYLQTKGIRRTRMSKLLVNKWVCFSMMVLFTILTFSVFLVFLRCRKRALIHWYRDPATILGSMLFLRDNTSLTSQVSIPASRLPPNELDTTWEDCRYTPFVLQTWVRITFLVFVISTFAALCYTTAISKTSDGLATIVHMDESYWNLLWTSLPATVMLSIALYISSSDSAHRNLAALSTLAQKPRNSVDLDMSLIDMLGLLSLYHSIKARLLAVTLAQILVMTCGFLSTLVSVVFTVEITPYSKAVEMKQTSWFASCAMKYTDDARTRRRLIGSLVLRQGDAALTWPRNTYDDLVFQNISTLDTSAVVSQNTTIRLTVPAAKLHGTCARLPNFKYSIATSIVFRGDYNITFSEPFACPGGGQGSLESTSNHVLNDAADIAYVASILKSPGNRKDTNATCGGLNDDDNYSAYRYQTYVWGSLSRVKDDFEYLTNWRCNYTWVELPTEISLLFADGEFILDPGMRPQPDVSSLRLWSPDFDVTHLNNQFDAREEHQINDSTAMGSVFPYISLIYYDNFGGMPEEFTAITRPHGRIPLEAFGDPSREAEIVGELNHNYAAFAAQLANLENRLDVDDSSRTGLLPPNLQSLTGTFTDGGRRRLVQNATVTYFILGILGLVILIHLTALLLNMFRRVDGEMWIFDMEVKGLAPDGLHSIAAAIALLKDSNALAYLPEGAHLLSLDELHGRLANLRFRMGWFQSADEDRKFTVSVGGDDDFKFLGTKKKLEHITS
ncbi:hypothetical protein CKAH01_04947 [Colletotrichum kahawae]|uniref:Uncharacterized protein n=1 Tax=Colletotrichum kahawae TaxID=34407 RepID=A0AAE0D6I2_COLKA|nr:hypothetical protein CKAH01_04947 [Colletotrichum kahawae]